MPAQPNVGTLPRYHALRSIPRQNGGQGQLLPCSWTVLLPPLVLFSEAKKAATKQPTALGMAENVDKSGNGAGLLCEARHSGELPPRSNGACLAQISECQSPSNKRIASVLRSSPLCEAMAKKLIVSLLVHFASCRALSFCEARIAT